VIGALEASTLCTVAIFRVLVFSEDASVHGALAICAALFVIVLVSAILGASLPIALSRVGMDAAHAGPTIQVIMDIVGVLISCSAIALVGT
jgi:Mg/Co/Ni transporter MgtE